MRPIRIAVILSVALAVVWATVPGVAQELTWSVDFGSVFDNREGDRTYTAPQTFFFTTLAPEIGVKLTANDRLAAGAVWTQPLTDDWKDGRVTPTIYYRREAGNLKFSMGLFPRKQLRCEMPGFLWCDSLAYFQPNIRGALVQYDAGKSFFEGYIDWRGMQSTTRREAFNIVARGEWSPRNGLFFLGGHVMMNHYALQKNAPENQHIIDNFLINPYVGLDFSSLSMKAGALITVERNRGNDNGWQMPAGVWIEALGEWHRIGLKTSFYAGGRLFPSYGEFGAGLYQGEPFYSARFYNRTDVYARVLCNKYVDLQASLDFNFTDDSFIFYQKLQLRVYFDSGNFSAR